MPVSFHEVHGIGLERFIDEPTVMAEGMAIAPERSGHGVEPYRAALERHRA